MFLLNFGRLTLAHLRCWINIFPAPSKSGKSIFRHSCQFSAIVPLYFVAHIFSYQIVRREHATLNQNRIWHESVQIRNISLSIYPERIAIVEKIDLLRYTTKKPLVT